MTRLNKPTCVPVEPALSGAINSIGNNALSEKPDMTRSQLGQLIAIVGFVLLVAIYWSATRLPENDPLRRCQYLFDMDQACVADVAASRLAGNRGF